MAESSRLQANVVTSFIETLSEPQVAGSAYVHDQAVVIGAVTLGERVFVAPFASVRGDEGTPIFVGDDSNVQDGVVIHGLETWENGEEVTKNLREVDGNKYSVYIGRGVSLAHQCHIHGPAAVHDGAFIGMQALVLMSAVGADCVIEPGVKLMGVNVPAGRYVPVGTVVKTQSEADALPEITDEYPLAKLNDGVVRVNVQLAEKYAAAAVARHWREVKKGRH